MIEFVAEPGCAVPMHLHRNEDEHFVVISGLYRIAVGNRILDATPGTQATVPRNTPHSWRNIAREESRLLATFAPGGFEQIVYEVKDTRPRRLHTSPRGLAATSSDHRSRNKPSCGT